jgi:hypothetical protein
MITAVLNSTHPVHPYVPAYASPVKDKELAGRGEELGTSGTRQMLEYAIEAWRGGDYLTPPQYCRLSPKPLHG